MDHFYFWIIFIFSFLFSCPDKSYELRHKTSVNKHIMMLTLVARHTCNAQVLEENDDLVLFVNEN